MLMHFLQERIKLSSLGFLAVIVCKSLLGPVHTNEISFENVYISMLLDLMSTLITHRFENAVESKQRRIQIVLVWTVENAS